jgi:hypothetical protein
MNDAVPRIVETDAPAREKFCVSIIADMYGSSISASEMSLAGLRDLVLNTTAPSKAGLKWLKLARFGTVRSKQNCLRHNDNVTAISGIEGDYDGEVMSLDEAIVIIRRANLKALIYTSANYAPERPRWRIVVPTSVDLPPADRYKLLARINGILGGILEQESFTLSQGFYFGRINSNPDHQAVVVDGDFIDLRPDLDAGAIGKTVAEPRPRAEYDAPSGDKTDAFMIEAALEFIPSDHYRVWFEVGSAIALELGDQVGRDIFDRWSAESKKYDARKCQKKWKDCVEFAATVGAYTMGTISHYASEAEPEWRNILDAEATAALAAAGPGSEADMEMMAYLAATKVARGNDGADAQEDEARAPIIEVLTPKTEEKVSTAPASKLRRHLLFSSGEFVAGFVPPDYLIDGLLLRKNVYAMTGRTGDGKTAVVLRLAAHVACGLAIGGLSVEKGRVVYFAGENPDDVRARWIKQCEEMHLNPEELEVFFMSGAHPISTDQVRGLIEADVAAIGPISLLIVDTSAAYYSGDDENDNVKLGAHARMLRSFVNLSGNPTVLTTCHPTKNPDMTNLLPRGGGAFLAEIDGNLVAIRERGSTLVVIDTHGKFRGPEFEPFSFKLMEGTSEKLKDSKGKLIWTVFAVPVAEAERAAMETAREEKRSILLRAMRERPASSIAELAVAIGWTYRNGNPNRTLVQRLLTALKNEKLVEKKGDRYVITSKGQKTVDEAENEAV